MKTSSRNAIAKKQQKRGTQRTVDSKAKQKQWNRKER